MAHVIIEIHARVFGNHNLFHEWKCRHRITLVELERIEAIIGEADMRENSGNAADQPIIAAPGR